MELSGFPDWSEFVSRVEDLLTKNYSCDAKFGLRVCTRNAQ